MYTRDSFKFAVLPSNYLLIPEVERESYLLDIGPQDADCVTMFSGVWARMSLALIKFHEEEKTQAPGWTRWKHADWYAQRGVSDRQKFAAWVGSAVVGMLNVRANYPSAYDSEMKVLYIEHIASSPGDLDTAIWARRLKGVGSALMAYAILKSCEHGYDGRIGLHASDANAKAYYEHLTTKYNMFYDPPKINVPGTPQDSKATDRFYFESVPGAAREFLEGYRDA